MKIQNALLGISLLCSLLACQNKQNESATDTSTVTMKPTADKFPVMKFEGGTLYEFGTITEGDTVSHVFKFTNTGNMPLLIGYANTSCGCTVPEWPREPIQPGKSGEIKVTFNSKNKKGLQNKPITIYANTNPETNVVMLKGTVKEKK